MVLSSFGDGRTDTRITGRKENILEGKNNGQEMERTKGAINKHLCKWIICLSVNELAAVPTTNQPARHGELRDNEGWFNRRWAGIGNGKEEI